MGDRIASDIESTLRVLAEGPDLDDDEVVQALCDVGLSAVAAEKLVMLVPLAFGAAVLAHMGVVNLPTTFGLKSREGDWVSLPLGDEPYFAHALLRATEMVHAGPREVFQSAALRSPQLNAVNDALNSGVSLEEINQAAWSETLFSGLDVDAWTADPIDDAP